MANPEHLKWLLEGVDSWNERRRKQDFKPDLSGTDLYRANLRMANFSKADLREADLSGANLRRANLRRADLGGAYLGGADVRTTPDGPTDLRGAIGLTQSRLETMFGDTGVLQPEGLHHPAHWPTWEGDETPAPSEPPQAPLADDALLKRIAASGPVTAVVRAGKIDAVDTPPGGKPAATNPADLENIFIAVESLCRNFQKQWGELKPNLRALIVGQIAHAQAMAAARERVWYLWDDQILYIETRLSDDADADWKGFDALARRVIDRIRSLEPYLKPAERRPEPPEVAFDDDAPDRIDRIAEAVEELRQSQEAMAVFTQNALNVLTDAVRDLREGLARLEQALISPKAAETGHGFWKKAILSLTAFLATAAAYNKDTIAIAANICTILALLLAFFH